MIRFLFFLCCFFLIGGASDDIVFPNIADEIIGLHMIGEVGDGGERVVWRECGKKLDYNLALARAKQYSEYIENSILDVYSRYGELIDSDHVVAIIYRESSYDECAIGHREARLLSRRTGKKVSNKIVKEEVRKWGVVNSNASRVCRKGRPGIKSGCVDREVVRRNPEYSGIHAWDLGASQFRWPGARTKKRLVNMPDGRVIKVNIQNLMKADVSIQMLVEDLAVYKRKCRKHTHWLKKKGRRLYRLSSDDAYFVHHHTGDMSWESLYWFRVHRHIRDIRSRRGD